MQAKIKLSEIAESMECQTEEIPAYLNRETGRITMLNADLLGAIEDGDDPQEALDMYDGAEEDITIAKEIMEGDKWLPLPSKFDINDYSIMQDFCRSQQNAALRSKLEDSIRGNGAFRRFRDAVEQAGVLEEWYDFRKAAYLEIARKWCEENGVGVATE